MSPPTFQKAKIALVIISNADSDMKRFDSSYIVNVIITVVHSKKFVPEFFSKLSMYLSDPAITFLSIISEDAYNCMKTSINVIYSKIVEKNSNVLQWVELKSCSTYIHYNTTQQYKGMNSLCMQPNLISWILCLVKNFSKKSHWHKFIYMTSFEITQM